MVKKVLVGLGILALYVVYFSLRPFDYTPVQSIVPVDTAGIDLAAVEKEALEHLTKMVQVPTIRKDENKVIDYIQSVLKKEKISYKLIAHPERKDKVSLIAELGPENSMSGVIMMGHSDVVEVFNDKWLFPPFDARVIDGRIYGRGVLDMKGMIALELVTFLNLKRMNIPLKNKVMLLITPDEESGGDYGAFYLTKEHSALFKQYKYVINEGGFGLKNFPGVGQNLFTVQVAEKGVVTIEAIAESDSGHSSMPPTNYSSLKLVRFLKAVTNKFTKVTVTAEAMPFFMTMGESLSPMKRFLLSRLTQPLIRPIVVPSLEQKNSTNAMIKNTLALTYMGTPGGGINVIPERVNAFLNIRILPAFSPDEIIAKIKKIADKYQVQLKVHESGAASSSDFNTEFFQVLKGAIEKHVSGAKVAPYMSPGATDNRFFRAEGLVAYGLIPILVTLDEVALLHNHNEYLKIENLNLGYSILFDSIVTLNR